MRGSFFLSIGIADLLLSYLLFSSQQYFSLPAMLGIFLIVTIGFAMIFLSYHYQPAPEGAKAGRYLVALALLSLASLASIIYEAAYGARYATISSATADSAMVSIAAAFAFVIGLQMFFFAERYTGKGMLNSNRYLSYALVVVLLVALSYVLYLFQAYMIQTTGWAGTDELAFNYYASTLFLHGASPYTASMQPILKTYSLDPTLLLNGTCECSYDYPALSFVLPAALAMGKYPNSFVFGTIMLATFVSFIIYKGSRWNRRTLLPVAVWFIAAFYITPASFDKYIAVSLFLLVAYIYRAKLMISGLCLGLATATSQLSWVALPFFYMLAFRASGKGTALKAMLITAAVFFLANGYFIALSPSKAIGNMLALLTAKLQFNGPSFGQLLLAFFPAGYWAVTVISIATLAIALLLFYLYTDTLRPFVAVAPIAISFISWRSLPSYTAAFIPLIIAVYYSQKDGVKDLWRGKKPIIYSLLLLIAASVAIIVYAHSAYLSANTLSIAHIVGLVGRNSTTGSYAISKILVNVSNNGNRPEQILFYVVSRSPNTAKYTPVTASNSLPTNTFGSYLLPVSLQSFNSTTKLYVFVLSNDYIKGFEVNSTGG